MSTKSETKPVPATTKSAVTSEETDQKNNKEEFVKEYPPKFLYSWGLNDFGQLGREKSTKPNILPKIVLTGDDILAVSVKQIVSGVGNTFILTDSGVVYGNGLNNIRQLADGDFLSHKFRKQEHLDDYEIEQMSVLWDTCYAVTKTGIVIAWGSNAYGQLGKDPAVVFSSRSPIELYSESPVVQVASGQRHGVILTKKGRVLTCGDFKNGQLGRPHQMYDYTPREIESLRNVKEIASGQHHNTALVKSKNEMKIFAWGWNEDGQCGDNPANQAKIIAPFEVALPVSILKGARIRCGWRHSGLMLASGELFLWGDNRLGQQGQEKKILNEPSPKRIKNLSSEELIKDFAAGFGHTVVILNSGMVVSWGDNARGSCGIGHTNSPVTFPLKTCTGIKRISTRVFAGYQQCFALTV